jgi:hypothetical protein
MVLSGDLSQTLITSARLALRAFKAADAAESFEAAKLAVRAEPDKLKGRIIRLAVDQNEIGSDVAVAVIAPLARRADDRNTVAAMARPSPGWRRFRESRASRRLPCRPDFSRL